MAKTAVNPTAAKKIEVDQMLAAAAAACVDKKGEDIRILALDPAESGLTDYFLICSGNSDRQNVAITDEIELRLKREFGTYPNSVEGRRVGEWILMDYVDFIVHVFSVEKRAFYGLERLRKSAKLLSVEDLNEEIKAAIAAGRKRKTAPAAVKKVVKKAAKKVATKVATKPAKTAKATKTGIPGKAMDKTPQKLEKTQRIAAKRGSRTT